MDNLFIEVEMIKTVHLIKRQIDEKITQTIDKSLTVSQAHVIGFISRACNHKDIFQKDIEKEFGLCRSSVSLMLNNMEKNGFIIRVLVNQDARLKKIVLTPKALKLQEKIQKEILETNKKLMKNISNEDEKIFAEVLKKMEENLK